MPMVLLGKAWCLLCTGVHLTFPVVVRNQGAQDLEKA